MNFPDAVKSGFENFVNFEGRAARSEFWWWQLFAFLVNIVASVIDASLNLGFLSPLASLALLAPGLAVAARRLHDINKSGWWQLLVLLPIIGWIVLLIWYVKQGDIAENRFGRPVV